MSSPTSHSSGVQSVPLETFSGQHHTLGYAVNGIPLPTQPYLATAPIVQGSTIDTGKHFTLFFASPDSQTLALLTTGTITDLQFLLADGRAPEAKVQITSSLSGTTFLVDVVVLSDASIATVTLPFVHLRQDGTTVMTQVFGEIPEDNKDKPLLGLYDPVTHSAVAAQAGTTITDNTNSVVYAPLASSGGGGGGGGAATIADGADIAEGVTTNTAVTGDNPGTVSAKLRGLNKIFADIWDSTNHWSQVKVMNATSLGQQLTIASISIVPASDSPNFPIKRNGIALFSTAQSTVGSGNSGDLNVAGDTEVSIDIKVTANAGTNPTIQFIYSRKGIIDGNYYPLWQSSVFTPALLSAQNNIVSVSIGSGMNYNVSLGLTGQLSWVVGGTATPTFTFTPNVSGK